MYGKDEALSILLLSNSEHINDGNWCNYTALICAAINGHSTCVDILVKHGAELNIQCKFNGNNALVYAARNNNKDCVKLLLQYNADVKVKNKKGKTAHDLTSSQEIKALLR